MLAQGVEKPVVAAFVKQQKAILEGTAVAATISPAASSPKSPTTSVSPMSATLSPPASSPNTPTTPASPSAPQSNAKQPLTGLTNEQIQEKAKDMLAKGVDKQLVAIFIKTQQAIQAQLKQQQPNQSSVRIQFTGIYQSKSTADLFVCYDCRYEIKAQESALTVANRYYHSKCFHCGKCKKDISLLDFFPVTDQMYCVTCYEDYRKG
jgi:uncharacterized CHY-type Zn-finger protein